MPEAHSPEHVALEQFISVLSHLGWSLGPSPKAEQLPTIVKSAFSKAPWTAIGLPDGQSLLIVSCARSLPNLIDPFKRFEDLAKLHRELIQTLSSNHIAGRYVVVIHQHEAQLLDIMDEDVLLSTHSRSEFEERLLPLLEAHAISRGSLTAFPRKSTRQRAQELADWTRIWSTRIGTGIDITVPIAETFFRWLHLSRVAELNRVGPISNDSFAEPAATVRFLDSRFVALYDEWNLLQDGNRRIVRDVIRAISDLGILSEFLESYSLLSRSRFRSDVVAEAFADDALKLSSWRSSVISSPVVSDADESWGTVTLPYPREIDYDASGYVVLRKTIDALVAETQRYARERSAARERGERLGTQLDLLSEVPAEFRPEEAATHTLKYLVQVTASDDARANHARLVVLSLACEWYARLNATQLPFPSIAVRIASVEPVEVTAQEQVNSFDAPSLN